MKELVVGLEQAWGGILELLSRCEAEDWNRPTPCEGWTVHDLAAHLGGVEAQFQGLCEPAVPEDPAGGIDAWTQAGVDARKSWTPEQVVAEVEAASSAQLDHLRGLSDEGWQQTRMGPIGETTERGLTEIRLFDIYIHLLDLRAALGLPLRPEPELQACEVAVRRAVEGAGWGAVKKAGLPEGTRIRLDLSGPGGATLDLVVEDGRGRLVPPEGDPVDRVTGSALAFALLASGRPSMAEAAGGVAASGEAATKFLTAYRLFQ